MISVPSFLLSLLFHSIRDVVAGQCWQGATYSETVVSPELRSSSILRVPEVMSLAQCAGACCDLLGCDLAWFFERRCYVLSCQHKENCQPKKRPGTDSLLAFLQRGPPQTLVLQSLVRGEPYPSHWHPLPKHRGSEDPLKDLALLEGIQDLDNSAVDYAENYRTTKDRGRDDVGEDRSRTNVEQEESPGVSDWPALQERDGFNLSEMEGGKRKLSLMGAKEDSPIALTPVPALTDGSRTSPSPAPPSWRPSPSTVPTMEDEEDQFNISITSVEPTAVLQGISTETSSLDLVSSSLPSQPDMETTSQTTSSQPAQTLVVSVGSVGEITPPENEVELTASVSSETEMESPYTYEWSLVSSPNGHEGVIEGKHSQTVKISELSAGVYVVRVRVTGRQASGESVVNFTVQPEMELNMPPRSVVQPTHQDVPLSAASAAIINGSQSSDDKGVVRYVWEQVSGPLWEGVAPMDTPVLRLQSISPGEYTFKLTVTDSEGLTDSTTATVRVRPKDDPPVARAGSDQVISLPLNHLTLWGNQSSDDHVISSYLWSLHPSSPSNAVTMQGVRSPALELSDLQEGHYSFQLTVTDSSGQRDSDTVSLSVLPENRAPVAVAGPDRQLLLPTSSITLNGSDSNDDHAITSYQWEILSGPPGSKIKDANSAVALVTGLRAGSHKFQLTVQDQQGAADSAVLTVTVKEAKNLPLVAHASGSHTLTLPNNSLVLKGSVSNFGSGNVSFLWLRDKQSPAAGDVLYASDHQASLYLANLVEGTYLFHLRATDSQGRSSTATATVEVRPDVGEREQVELELQVAVAQISEQQKDTVLRQLAALLHVLDADIALKGLRGQSHISTVFRFSVQGPDGTVPGPKLARLLRLQLLKEKTDFLLFKVLRVDTVMCLLSCSGHGRCDPISKSCSCDPLWMENPFRHFFDDNESNCDWSALYVAICCIAVFVFLVSSSWVWCKRGRRTKVRKKTKYTILDNVDEQERMELQPKYIQTWFQCLLQTSNTGVQNTTPV
ncbi:dyslexia-associated protein KIAA0319 isoform X2 [Brachyhypopomus gauderio]|uniref:dyslexia-associated protein KIAA0319 isoform X2 n=1 Tax=Brachyhypopomus gauderio TaxID=698409 RepID=UPI0040417B77